MIADLGRFAALPILASLLLPPWALLAVAGRAGLRPASRLAHCGKVLFLRLAKRTGPVDDVVDAFLRRRPTT